METFVRRTRRAAIGAALLGLVLFAAPANAEDGYINGPSSPSVDSPMSLETNGTLTYTVETIDGAAGATGTHVWADSLLEIWNDDGLYSPGITDEAVWKVTGPAAAFHTFRVTPSVPVRYLDFHVNNLDGSWLDVSGTSSTGDPITVTRTAGNPKFNVSGNRLNESTRQPTGNGCQTTQNTAHNGACGTVRIAAPTGFIQALTFDNRDNPWIQGGDGWSWTITIPGPSVEPATGTATAGVRADPVILDADSDVTNIDLGSPDAVELYDETTDTWSSEVTTDQGTYVVQPDGSIIFTPDPAFEGETTPLTFRVTDPAGLTATNTLTYDVEPAPAVDPPGDQDDPPGDDGGATPPGTTDALSDPGDDLLPATGAGFDPVQALLVALMLLTAGLVLVRRSRKARS